VRRKRSVDHLLVVVEQSESAIGQATSRATCGTPSRRGFSTAAFRGRVIDELMGHQASGRGGRHLGSAIGAHYRHTTPEMAARVVTAVEQRLVVALATAEAVLDQQPW